MKNRYWFLSVILLFLICLALFQYFYENEKEREIEEILNHQKLHTLQAAQSFQELFNKWYSVLFHLSGDPNVIDLNEQGRKELVKFQVLFKDEITGITRMNKNGKISYTVPIRDNSIGADISDQKHILALMSEKKPIVSDVFESVQGYMTIAIHYPVFKEGSFDGSIAFILNFEEICDKILSEIKLGESGHAWMITEGGIQLYSPNKNEIGKNISEVIEKNPEFFSLVKRMKKGKEGSEVFPCYKNGKYTDDKIVYFKPIKIDGTFWSVAVLYSESEITASIENFRNNLLIVIIVVFSGGIVFLYFGLKGLFNLRELNIKEENSKALEESKEKYRLISNISSDYMFYSKVTDDGDLRLTWAEGAFEKITGYTMEEYINAGGWRGRLSPEDFEKDKKDFDKLLKNEKVVTEVRTISKNEDVVWVKVYAQPDWDKNAGKLAGIYGAVQNITERKQAEETVKILSSVVEQSQLSILITGLDGKIEYANKRVTKVSGFSINELLGEKPSIFKSGKMPDEYYKEMWETVLSGLEWRGEFFNKKKSGEYFWESALISPLKNDEGEITHIIGIKEDITEKKNLLQELVNAKEGAEKSEKLKSEFLAQMSHEIRTPLNSILSFSDLLESEVHDKVDKELKQSFGLINSAGRRIIRTIDMILGMSEIVTESYDLNPKKVSLTAKILEPIIPEYIQKAKTKNLMLELKVESENDEVIVDEYTTAQIFHNIIDNAIKYTEMGSVVISVSKKNHQCIVEITDTGIGISPEYLDRIFDPFTQEQQGYTRKYEGNGLGLALVKRYCELNGAEINIESRKGEGSKFTVIFRNN